MKDNIRLAKELIGVAKVLVSDADYIYDPEHKKHPGGGYHKTESGWSKSEQKQENNGNSNAPKNYANEPMKVMHREFQEEYNLGYPKSDRHWAVMLCDKNMHPKDLHQFAQEITSEMVDQSDFEESAKSIVRNPNTSDETLLLFVKSADRWKAEGLDEIPDQAAQILNERRTNGTAKSLKNAPLLNKDPEQKKQEQDAKDKARQEKQDAREKAKRERAKLHLTELKRTPPNILSALAQDDNPRVRRSVCYNPNTPQSTIESLAKNDASNGVRGTAARFVTSKETLAQLAGDSSESVRCGVAMNSNASAEILNKLSTDANDYVRRDVSGNANTSSSTLDKLVLDRDFYVRQNVASHQNTSPSALDGLSRDKDRYVRRNVAENRNTPVATLDKLVDDKEGTDVWHSALRNPKTSMESITRKFMQTSFEERDEPIFRETFFARRPNMNPAAMKQFLGNSAPRNMAALCEAADYKKGGKSESKTPQQLKSDFIANMNPSNYASMESYQRAMERVKSMTPDEVAEMFAAINA